MKLLIDGDTIAYVSSFASEDIESISLVRKIVTDMLQRICYTLRTYQYEIFLTDSDRTANFRHDLATIKPYKGNRKDKKPKWLGTVREYLIDVHHAVVITGKEADDELGSRQTDDTIIVTIDKDLAMIPGRHYNFKTDRIFIAYDPGQLALRSTKDSKGGTRYSLQGVGFKWLCAQCMLGDTVDNIPGLDRYGPKTIFTLLWDKESVPSLWKTTMREFHRQGKLGQLEEIVELLWIHRDNQIILDWCKSRIVRARSNFKK